jgi:hypothetical protein
LYGLAVHDPILTDPTAPLPAGAATDAPPAPIAPPPPDPMAMPPAAVFPGYPPPPGAGGPCLGHPPPPGSGGPYPGYPPPPGYPYPGPQRSAGTNGFAIASLVLSIFGGGLLGVVFGIVALVQIRKNGQRGKGLAIAGLALSGLWLTILLAALAAGFVAGVRDAGRDATSAAGETGTGQDFQPGECVNDVGGAMPVVSCEEPHEGEVYAVITLPAGPWPGQEPVRTQARSRCSELLDRYTSDPDAPAGLTFSYLFPTAERWDTDRTANCIATDPAGPMMGSLHD